MLPSDQGTTAHTPLKMFSVHHPAAAEQRVQIELNGWLRRLNAARWAGGFSGTCQDICQANVAAQNIPKSRQLIEGVREQETTEHAESCRALACRPEPMPAD